MVESIRVGDLSLVVLRDMRQNPERYPSKEALAAHCDECDEHGLREKVANTRRPSVVMSRCSHLNAIKRLLAIAEGLPRYRRPASLEDAAGQIVEQFRALNGAHGKVGRW